jgi:hypothetical protein
MSTNIQVVALERALFEPLFALDDATLRTRGIERRVVQETSGTPCRVSLTDAPVGERVLLLPFTHHDVDSPYRASGPIFVREVAETARPAVNELPGMLTRRLLSVRAYGAQAMLVDADVLDGAELADRARKFFANPKVSYLHVHNARPGCFNCRIERAPG